MSYIKWSTKKIKDHLLKNNRSLELISDFSKSKNKCVWKCQECDYVWEALLHNIINGKGCIHCAGNVQLNNDVVDFRLKDKDIIRVDDYINNSTEIQFKCLKEKCNFIWHAKPLNIFNDKGCPKCAKNAKITNQIFDERLLTRPIKRISSIINTASKIKLQCLICNIIWEATPNSINNGHGCPTCGLYKNEKLVKQLLQEYNIYFYSNYNIKNIIEEVKNSFRVDFYLPNKNIILEYNGIQHYKPTTFGKISKEKAQIKFEKQIIRDQFIRDFSFKNGIKLIEIDGRKFYGNLLKNYIDNLVKEF